MNEQIKNWCVFEDEFRKTQDMLAVVRELTFNLSVYAEGEIEDSYREALSGMNRIVSNATSAMADMSDFLDEVHGLTR